MKPVNLLPQGHRRQEAGGRPGSAYVVVGVLAAFLVAIGVYVLTANQVSSKQDDLARVKQETQATQARVAALGSFESFASVKATRENSVRALAQARLDWERLMRELARVLPANAFISSLDATAAGPPSTPTAGAAAAPPAGPEMKLAGCAPSQPDVATVMVRLRRLHRAREVKLTESHRAENGGGTAGGGAAQGCGRGYEFAVTVQFDAAPAVAAPETVPAHLGGGA